jgi:division protein CdvB (Snf7/Vps24/ESCRT-III family)
MLLQKELEQQHLLMEVQQLSLAVAVVEVGAVVQLLEMLVELAVEVKELLDLFHLLVEPQMEQPILAVVAVV